MELKLIYLPITKFAKTRIVVFLLCYIVSEKLNLGILPYFLFYPKDEEVKSFSENNTLDYGGNLFLKRIFLKKFYHFRYVFP